MRANLPNRFRISNAAKFETNSSQNRTEFEFFQILSLLSSYLEILKIFGTGLRFLSSLYKLNYKLIKK